MADHMFTLGVLLSAKDLLSPAMGQAGKNVTELGAKIQAVSGKMAVLGTASYGAGRAMLSPIMSTVNEYQELAKAQGDVASLGIAAKGIDAITKSAKQFSNQYAGDAASEIVAASYDIKSGISSLTDEGVAKFTTLAAVTGRATKSTTGEMTKLFALGYGIFKNMDETDFQFGERMSAQVSLAVKAFRTEGSDLTLGISNIGAQAKVMGVSLAEELAIIGNAKGSFNSASEAATGYRAFLDGAANAQDKLGLTFTNAEGKMLPMVDILNQIKEKYGDSLGTLAASKELKDAFGSSEAVKIVTGLINKTDALTASQKQLNNATMENVEIMAKARNKGHEFEILDNQITNLSTTIGAVFAPVAIEMASVIGSVVTSVQNFTEKHETATKVIGYTVAGLGALLTVAGAVLIPIAAIGMAMPFLTTGIATLSGAVSIFTGALGFMGTAMKLAFGPIGIAVAAIAYGAYLIYDNWEPISAWFGGLWDGIRSIFSSAWSGMKTAFSWSPLGLIINSWGKMFDWLGSKFEWFKNSVGAMADIGSSIAGFFGFGEGGKKVEIGKSVKRLAVGTAVAAQVATAQPVSAPPVQMTQPTQQVSSTKSSHSVSNTYHITVQVQSGDPQEIASEVRKVIAQMESSRRNRSYSDEEM